MLLLIKQLVKIIKYCVGDEFDKHIIHININYDAFWLFRMKAMTKVAQLFMVFLEEKLDMFLDSISLMQIKIKALSGVERPYGYT